MLRPGLAVLAVAILTGVTLFLLLSPSTSSLEQTPGIDSGYLVEAAAGSDSLSWGVQRRSGQQPPQADPLSLRCLEGRGIWIGDTGTRRVYLTFNCGWENGLTRLTLDTLQQHQVPAAFFLTGEYAGRNPELVKRMAAEGHLLGTHGETHRSFPLLTEAEARRELIVSSEKIARLTGVKPRYFRPPGGEFNRLTLKLAQELGFTTVFWSLSYPDWDVAQQPGRQAAFKRVISDIHPGAIIQLHTVSSSSNQALGDIIQELKAQGYTLGTLDELKTPH